MRGTLQVALLVFTALLWPLVDARAAATVAAPMPATTPCVAVHESAADGQPASLRDCADSPSMIAIPAGSFRMGDVLGTGSIYEKPVHEVHVRAFLLSRFETTREQWAACESAGACTPPQLPDADMQMPVAGVSWEQARQYAAWLSAHSGHRYRLPSEAEWEYAARAGAETQYSWGNMTELACRHANSFDRAGHHANPQWDWQIECNDGYAAAAPVGRFPPNAWGLYDMLGNVWEWVEDCWHSDYEGAPADGSAWVEAACRKHVNRGGGWGNHPRSLRLSNRDGDETSARSDGLGFRVARDAGP